MATTWNVIFFLAVFLILADTLGFHYVQNQITEQSIQNDYVNQYNYTNMTANLQGTGAVTNLHANAPSGIPWGITIFLAFMNAMVILIGYMLIRGIW